MRPSKPLRTLAFLAALSALPVASTASAGSQIYVTNFNKDNNIYTDLNEQFPHSGVGTPGSQTGTPNARYLFSPPSTGASNLQNDVNNAINFEITSNASGYDFEQIGACAGNIYCGPASLTLPTDIKDATAVYFLMGAYNGNSFNVTFSGTNGATQTFSDIYVPDFNGGSINAVGAGYADQTVFQVLDVGGGATGNSVTGDYNYYDLTEVGFQLGPQFQNSTLTSATITANGYEVLLLGATGVGVPVPEPASWALMLSGLGALGVVMRARRRAAIA